MEFCSVWVLHWTEAGSLTKRLRDFRKVLEIRQENDRSKQYDATTYNLMGKALPEKARRPKLSKNFEKATRLHPGFGPNLYDQALALVRLNRFEEAQESVEAALRADANLALAHELRGGLLARKQQLTEAARDINRCSNYRPASAGRTWIWRRFWRRRATCPARSHTCVRLPKATILRLPRRQPRPSSISDSVDQPALRYLPHLSRASRQGPRRLSGLRRRARTGRPVRRTSTRVPSF